MKKINLLLIMLCTIAFASCDKKAKVGNVNVYFNNLANGQNISIGAEPSYTNILDQKFSVNKLKYYVHNVRLVNDKGVETAIKDYTLINEDPTELKRDVLFSNIANGSYKTLKFNLGVEPSLNATGTNIGDLNPINGMFWAWTGYIFLMHEGKFINNLKDKQGLIFHQGGDKNYLADITIPITNLLVDGNSKKLVIDLALEKMYNGIDFNIHNSVMGDEVGDEDVLNILRDNLKTAFTFNSVQ